MRAAPHATRSSALLPRYVAVPSDCYVLNKIPPIECAVHFFSYFSTYRGATLNLNTYFIFFISKQNTVARFITYMFDLFFFLFKKNH